MRAGDLGEGRVAQDLVGVAVALPERSPRLGGDPASCVLGAQLGLLEVRMALDLVDRRRHSVSSMIRASWAAEKFETPIERIAG